MSIFQQRILPAANQLKDLEKIMETPYEYVVMLGTHISQLESVVQLVKSHGKKIFLHADLIQGLNNDDYAAEYLSQVIKPSGLISTRSNVILKAKQNGLLAIQRLFLLDSNALEKDYSLVERTRPDFIEVLPGIMPHIIKEVHEKTKIPIFAGGLIRSEEDVDKALQAGVVAVTTSRKDLWK
jgi:glycerol uptake operon antiterminator